jgi:hypothetical protein
MAARGEIGERTIPNVGMLTVSQMAASPSRKDRITGLSPLPAREESE